MNNPQHEETPASYIMELINRYLERYLRIAEEASSLPHGDYASLQKELPHLNNAMIYAEAYEKWEHVCRLCDALTANGEQGFFRSQGLWTNATVWLEKAVKACQMLRENATTAEFNRWLRREISFRLRLCDIHFARSAYSDTIACLESNLKICEQYESDNVLQEALQIEIARIKLRLGELYLNRNLFDDAIVSIRESLKISEQLVAKPQIVAQTLFWLGRAYHRNRQYEEAQKAYENSKQLYDEQLQDRTETANVTIRLGELAYDKARAYYEEAKGLLDKSTNDLNRATAVRLDLANEYRWKRLFEFAIPLHKECLEHFERLGDRRNIAWSLQALGDTYFENDNIEEAEPYLLRAREAFEELGILTGLAYASDHLGLISLRRGEYDKARSDFSEALETFRLLEIKDGVGYLLYNLGDTEYSDKNWENASEYYQQSLKIWEEISLPDRIELTRRKLAAVAAELEEEE